MHLRGLVLLALVGASAPLLAQSTVVPNANATTRGTSQLNSIIRNAANPRTYMLGVNASELAGIPLGSFINGFSLRFMVFGTNPASWPPADITWSSYDIFVGAAIPVATFTGNFMANFASPPVQVRSGPMVLPANTYTNTNPPAPGVNAWGEFYFDFQVPYQYLGGDLGLLFSHPGSNDPATAMYPETVASSLTTYGGAFTQSTYPVGSSGAATTYYVHRIHYGIGTGCPGTGGLTPNLVQNQNTTGGLGGPIRLTVSNAPATTVGLIVFGLQVVPIPLPNNCTLMTAPITNTVLLTNATGSSSFTLNVPAGVLGSMTAQVIVIDGGASGGFTVTNAVRPAAF